jgi:hypothetical protein
MAGQRIFMSRLSDSVQSADAEAGGQRLLMSGSVTYARQFIALTATAADHADCLGNWILAAGATGIRAFPSTTPSCAGVPALARTAPTYQRATSASYAELLSSPLVGGHGW